MLASCALVATTLSACGGRYSMNLDVQSDLAPSAGCKKDFPGDYQAQVACQQGRLEQRRENYNEQRRAEEDEEFYWRQAGYDSVKYDIVAGKPVATLDCTRATNSRGLQSECIRGQGNGYYKALRWAHEYREEQLENARQQGRNKVGSSPHARSSSFHRSSPYPGQVLIWKTQ